MPKESLINLEKKVASTLLLCMVMFWLIHHSDTQAQEGDEIEFGRISEEDATNLAAIVKIQTYLRLEEGTGLGMGGLLILPTESGEDQLVFCSIEHVIDPAGYTVADEYLTTYIDDNVLNQGTTLSIPLKNFTSLGNYEDSAECATLPDLQIQLLFLTNTFQNRTAPQIIEINESWIGKTVFAFDRYQKIRYYTVLKKEEGFFVLAGKNEQDMTALYGGDSGSPMFANVDGEIVSVGLYKGTNIKPNLYPREYDSPLHLSLMVPFDLN